MPLVQHLSNVQFISDLGRLIKIQPQATPDTDEATGPRECCRCGCGQLVPPGRKFVNQAHYDRMRGLPPADAKRIIASFRQGVSQKQLARDYGVDLSMVKRLIRKHGQVH